MLWILSIEKNRQGKLVRMEYGRIDECNEGVRITTRRGVEYGSGITGVCDTYGTNPTLSTLDTH